MYCSFAVGRTAGYDERRVRLQNLCG
jgi:hypothetical protein